MEHVTFSHRLRGQATAVGPGMLEVELRARRTRVVSRLEFLDEVTFRENGTMDFGGGDSLRFQSVGRGTLVGRPDRRLSHGTTVLEIQGGAGRYARARGRITSNFVLAEDGGMTDLQVGVIFVDGDLPKGAGR